MSALQSLGVDGDLPGPARSPGGLCGSLAAVGHPVPTDLATVAWLALALHRPILVEPADPEADGAEHRHAEHRHAEHRHAEHRHAEHSHAGQSLAEGLAAVLGRDLVRITCHPAMAGGDGLPARAVQRARRTPAVLLVEGAHTAPQPFLDGLLAELGAPGPYDPVLVLVAARPVSPALARRCLTARP
ncbi:hypothetical protein ACIB24_05435 [Spongisporangium articulatum]|uniref:Uncharacterized protein n=1 Tax=Spongisporangium articulatum TaxID=3362603 RepID=A0ABW8AJE6_9ACTN